MWTQSDHGASTSVISLTAPTTRLVVYIHVFTHTQAQIILYVMYVWPWHPIQTLHESVYIILAGYGNPWYTEQCALQFKGSRLQAARGSDVYAIYLSSSSSRVWLLCQSLILKDGRITHDHTITLIVYACNSPIILLCFTEQTAFSHLMFLSAIWDDSSWGL